MLSVTGASLKALRFHVDGIIIFASFVVFEHLYLLGFVSNHGIPLAGFISGGVIVLSGLIILRRFIRIYKVEN